MLCFHRLGLIFRAVMFANHEISDNDIYLEVRVIVIKYSFKFNNHDPLCKKNFQKKFTGTLSQGRSGSGWGDHKHLQVILNT